VIVLPSVRMVLLRSVEAAQEGLDSEDLVDVVGGAQVGHPNRAPRDQGVPATQVGGRHGLERAVLGPPPVEVPVGDAEEFQVPLRSGLIQIDQLLRTVEGQRPDEETVHDPEHGRVSGNADRHQHDHGQRVHWLTHQLARREPHISPQGAHVLPHRHGRCRPPPLTNRGRPLEAGLA
jgi:hypothetical protein